MPSRLFRIHLVNNTAFTLFRATDDHHLHGAWTNPWQPPPTIDPGATGAWQAESDGLWQGTDGHLVYGIATPTPTIVRFRIDWNNPFWGVTDSDPSIVSSIPGIVPSAPGFEFVGGGARPMNSYPGAVDTAGWLEVIPGLVVLPIPWYGVIDHAWSVFAVNAVAPPPPPPIPTFGSVSPPDVVFVPVEGESADVWNGTWVYPVGEKPSAEVSAEISSSLLPVGGPTGRRGVVFFRVDLNEKSTRAGVPPLTIQQGDIVKTTSRAFSYRQDIWPPRRSSAGRIALVSSALRGGSSVTAPSGALPSTSPQGTTTANKFDPFDTADSIVSQYGNITLMLYSMHQRGGPYLGNCVRYLRHSDDGAVVADVMLHREVHPPR